MRRWPALLAFLLAAAPLAAGEGRIVAGTDRALVVPPAGAVVEPYRNLGYELRFADGALEVSVEATPIASRAPLALPDPPAAGPVAERARALAAGAPTVYDAVTRVLGWIRGNVRYELDRGQVQEPDAVLARGSAYCTGIARLGVAMLAAIGVEAREVPGYVLEQLPAGPRVGFHRWIEVRYPDRGWAFSDPLASLHYVPATYLRLGAERLEVEPGEGSLIEHRDGLEEIDLAPEAGDGLRVRRNDDRRAAAALVVRLVGGVKGEASLEGAGFHRSLRLEEGAVRFLGLGLGSYRLEVRTPEGGRIAHKDLVFREPVLAEIEVAVPLPALAGGGSKPGPGGQGGRGSR